MKADQTLDELADQFGIVPTYRDLTGVEKPTSRETKIALLRANGLSLDSESDIKEQAKAYRTNHQQRTLPEELVCTSETAFRLTLPRPGDWRIYLEGQQNHQYSGQALEHIDIPPLPAGLHELHFTIGSQTETLLLIAAPKTAPSLAEHSKNQRIWGINAALYGLHSTQTGGMGNFEHLSRTAQFCAHKGADFVGINPVHAIGWHSPEIISPYSPSHRGFLNPLHIAAPIVAQQLPQISQTSRRQMVEWENQPRARVDNGAVDYTMHTAHQRPLLKSLFADFLEFADARQRAEFKSFCNDGGAELARFVQFEHHSGMHGADWTRWPSAMSNSEDGFGPGSSLDLWNADEDIRFHAWLQWIAHQQLTHAHHASLSAGMCLGLYLDLAVGARRTGAEAWCEKSSIADGVSVGAPPDHLSPAGQNWNLAAFAPKKLAANKYRAFRAILRQNMQHCGIIRIDHVLGLNRSFWIPDDGTPGGYIKQNFETLLALVRIEAQRSNTVVVGEDLGLVPDGFRKSMNQRNIYSYSVLQYEKNEHGKFRAASQLSKNSLICFGTHDTPTLAGFMQGRDIDWWLKLGWINADKADVSRAERKLELDQLFQLDKGFTLQTSQTYANLRKSVYGFLAASKAAMLSVQLDDIFGEVEAQNLPGTVAEHQNWQRKYAVPVEEFGSNPDFDQMSQIMMAQGRGNLPPTNTEKTE